MMDTNFESNRQYLERELKKHRLEVTPEAWRPLQRIKFEKLVQIHDHEEHFLRTVFIESLRRANRLRISSGRGTSKVNAHDVATALLMLDSAVESASEGSIAQANKALVKDVCPYC